MADLRLANGDGSPADCKVRDDRLCVRHVREASLGTEGTCTARHKRYAMSVYHPGQGASRRGSPGGRLQDGS
eukprot:7142839-Alexandrium_andersonii.AAC.1